MDDQTGVGQPHPLATFQWFAGIVLLAMAGWFFFLDRTTSPTHFIGRVSLPSCSRLPASG